MSTVRAAELTAIVIAGGAGRRLGGIDKPALLIGATTLLDRALAALSSAESIVVVGPCRPVRVAERQRVRWTMEQPRGSGPVAALAAGLALLAESRLDTEVALLAADLLAIDADTIARLRAALRARPAADGALLVDGTGHRQWLTSLWRLGALRRAMPADPAGTSLRAVLGGLTSVEVAERPGETEDVDTPADLTRARQRTEQRDGHGDRG